MLYTPKSKEKIEISNDDLYDSTKEKLIKDAFEVLEEILNRNICNALECEWYVETWDVPYDDWKTVNKELLYKFYKDLVDELCDYLNHEDELSNLRGE